MWNLKVNWGCLYVGMDGMGYTVGRGTGHCDTSTHSLSNPIPSHCGHWSGREASLARMVWVDKVVTVMRVLNVVRVVGMVTLCPNDLNQIGSHSLTDSVSVSDQG